MYFDIMLEVYSQPASEVYIRHLQMHLDVNIERYSRVYFETFTVVYVAIELELLIIMCLKVILETYLTLHFDTYLEVYLRSN